MVAILCAKWWRKWQDYTNQAEDDLGHTVLDSSPVRKSVNLEDPLMKAIQMSKVQNLRQTEKIMHYKKPGQITVT